MKFSISRDSLVRSLNLVAGVVERRQTLPILANVLLVLKEDWLSLTGTDLEVELVGRIQLAVAGEESAGLRFQLMGGRILSRASSGA